MFNKIGAFLRSDQTKQVVKDVAITITVLVVTSLIVSGVKAGAGALVDQVQNWIENSKEETPAALEAEA